MDENLYGPKIDEPRVLHDSDDHLFSMRIKSWLPGEHLQAEIERAVRNAARSLEPVAASPASSEGE